MSPRLLGLLLVFALTLPVPVVDGLLAAWAFVALVYGQVQAGSSQASRQITSSRANQPVRNVVGSMGASRV